MKFTTPPPVAAANPAPSVWKAWIPVLLVLAAIAIFWNLDIRSSYDSAFLRLSFNFVFLTLTSLFVAFLFGRSFLLRGTPGLLLMGCGLLLYSAAGTVGVIAGGHDPNLNVTIHNFILILSASFQLAGAILSLRPGRTLGAPGVWLATAYTVCLLVVVIIVQLATTGQTPVFFIPDHGGTPIRQAFLSLSAGLLLLASLVLTVLYQQSRTRFLVWYALGLVLTSAGLIGVMGGTSFGTPLIWASRGAQYVGGAYLLVAAVVSVRESRDWSMTLEESLSRARQQYRDMFELAADGILVYAYGGGGDIGPILQANPSLCAMLEYTEDELRQMTPLDIAAPEDHALAMRDRDRILREGVLRHEKTLMTRSGRRIYAEISSRAFEDQGQRRIMSMIRDITERRRAEQQLRELSQRLLYHVDHSPLAVIEFDGEMRITRWSGAAQRIFGWSAEEVLGKQVDEFRWVYPDDVPRVQAVVKGLQSGTAPQWFSANRNFRKDGTILECEWHNSSLLDENGRFRSILSMVMDVTARKRAEQALRDSEQRFNAFMDATPMLAWIKDESGRYLYLNHAWAIEFGVEPGEWLGKTAHDLFAPEVADELVRTDREVLNHGHPMVVIEETAGGPSGSPRFWHTVKFPFQTSSGQKLVGGTAVNITDQRVAEERLRHAQKLESIGLLAGGIAHDFNNLLVGVMGNASLAESTLPPDHPAQEFLHNVVQSGERAAHLTRQMLAYAGKGQFVVEPIDLSALVEEIHGLVRPSIPGRVTVKLDLAPDLPPIMADGGQIQQVVMNLLINAGEAIGEQQGLISVRTGQEQVSGGKAQSEPVAGELQSGDYVFLEVRDTGSGMDDATRARIFDPFFTTKFTGRGLGLAAVAGIVRGHHGSLRVSSEPGSGSCFRVLFPVGGQQVLVAAKPAKESQPAARLHGTVLLVDDEPVVVKMTRALLERLGLSVITATNGVEAIEVFYKEASSISLVLLDLSMPGLSGADTLRELRRCQPQVKVLAISGYSEEETRTLFRDEAISGFLQKPYTHHRLAQAVSALLE